MAMNEDFKEVRGRIADDMMQLLGRSADEGLVWRSSKTDLMEMVHILYCTDMVRDADGLPMTFRELVRRVCDIVHESVPRNPGAYVMRARQRKGRRALPLEERYRGLFI